MHLRFYSTGHVNTEADGCQQGTYEEVIDVAEETKSDTYLEVVDVAEQNTSDTYEEIKDVAFDMYI